MTDKINQACDKLAADLNKLGMNTNVIDQHGTSLVTLFLKSSQEALNKLREDTTQAVEEALVRQSEYEQLKTKLEESQVEIDQLKEKVQESQAEIRQLKTQLIRSRDAITKPSSESGTNISDKRLRIASMGNIQGSSSRPRGFNPLERIEELPVTLRSSSEGSLAFRPHHPPPTALPSAAISSLATLWTDNDDVDGDSRLAWVESHSTFDGEWSADDRSKWREQMGQWVKTKPIDMVVRTMDDYAVGDKRTWPPIPRPCFFGRMKRVKCSPGGNDTARSKCDFCKVIKGSKGSEKAMERCHCTCLLAHGVSSPYPERDEEGSLGWEATYSATPPFFNEMGARYTWSVHT